MTADDKKTFIEFLTKLVEENDNASVHRIVEETYGGNTHPAVVLARLAAVTQALTASKPFEFFTKHSRSPLMVPTCLGCEGAVNDGTVHPELPSIALCATCMAYISLGRKVESDKHRILDSLTLVLEESKALCGESEEGCVRCQSNADLQHLIEALRCIKK